MNDDRILSAEEVERVVLTQGLRHETVQVLVRSHEALRARLAATEAERAVYRADFDDLHVQLVAAEARAERVEAALREAEDFRAEIVVDAFTAPDADWATILDSLRARIRDLSGGIPEDGCYYDPARAALGKQEGEER